MQIKELIKQLQKCEEWTLEDEIVDVRHYHGSLGAKQQIELTTRTKAMDDENNFGHITIYHPTYNEATISTRIYQQVDGTFFELRHYGHAYHSNP